MSDIAATSQKCEKTEISIIFYEFSKILWNQV